MSTVTASLVPVPTSIAVKAAQNMLQWVELKRAKIREESICSVMRKRTVKTGWFKKRPVTRAEAEDIVDNELDPFCDDYDDDSPLRYEFYRHRIVGRGNETLAKHLLASAKVCDGNVIYLSIKDAYHVEDFAKWVDPTPALGTTKTQEATEQS
jgi:hypothetical protein